MTRLLTNITEIKDLAKTIIQITKNILGAKYSQLYIINEEQEVLYSPTSENSINLNFDVSLLDFIKNKYIIKITDKNKIKLLQYFPDIDEKIKNKYRYLLLLRDNNNFIGFILLSNLKILSSQEKNFIKLFSNFISNLIAKNILYTLAITDSLTGLYIKRFFNQRLKEEVKRAKRYKKIISLIMIDIDHFKKINDTYGHIIGDKILSKLGKILINQSRKDIDIPCRYGGEEFSIILPETDIQGALKFSQRLSKIVKNTIFDKKNNIKITISIGIANFPLHAKTQEDLIRKSDIALYKAKKNGRDRIEIYQEEDNNELG